MTKKITKYIAFIYSSVSQIGSFFIIQFHAKFFSPFLMATRTQKYQLFFSESSCRGRIKFYFFFQSWYSALRTKKFIGGGKWWNKSCWIWFKLLTFVSYFFPSDEFNFFGLCAENQIFFYWKNSSKTELREERLLFSSSWAKRTGGNLTMNCWPYVQTIHWQIWVSFLGLMNN